MLQEEEQQFYKGEKAPESKNAEGKAVANESEAVCGVPVGSVVLGEPVEQPRQPWSTGLLCCLGRNDEFCSSDMQVCELLLPPLECIAGSVRIWKGSSC